MGQEHAWCTLTCANELWPPLKIAIREKCLDWSSVIEYACEDHRPWMQPRNMDKAAFDVHLRVGAHRRPFCRCHEDAFTVFEHHTHTYARRQEEHCYAIYVVKVFLNCMFHLSYINTVRYYIWVPQPTSAAHAYATFLSWRVSFPLGCFSL